MQIFPSKSECCGCSACKQICPKGAIAMKPDSEGFLYPQIDVSLWRLPKNMRISERL